MIEHPFFEETMTPRAARGVRWYSWALLVFCGIVSVFLHARSFSVPHREGDEVVYLALASEMHWDFTHYTTKDHPDVKNFPGVTYTNAIFHQPPLLPYVLKLGRALGNPLVAGLVFQCLACLLLLYFLLRFARFFRIPEASTSLLLALGTCCPFLLFSTTRLHLDGLFAIFFFCGLSLYVEAEHTRSRALAAGAAALLVLAFNTRYTALALLPLVLAVPLLGPRFGGSRPGGGEDAGSRWQRAAIVGLPLLTLGGFHYWRLLFEYQTLSAGQIMGTGNAQVPWNQFIDTINSRTRLQVLAALAMTLPLLGVVALPPFRRLAVVSWRRGSWEVFYLGSFVYAFAVNFATDYSFRHLRYFCTMTPFLYATAALVYTRAGGTWRRLLALLIALTMLLMVSTSFYNTVVMPGNAKLYPSLMLYLPALRQFYP